jgi:hypothetical protein
MENVYKAFNVAGVFLDKELINIMVRLIEQGADPKAIAKSFFAIR